MGKLTTHVLDTYLGKPAAHLRVELWRVEKNGLREQIVETHTNQDGRAPLIDPLEMGEYELLFFVRPYFEQHSGPSPFLNIVPVRFTIFDADANYHVPLLVSPWSYTTYRGS